MRQSDIETKTFSQKQLAEYFVNPLSYRKTGTVEARQAIPGEMIATVIDGEIETINHAKEHDVVIRNPNGEQYIIDQDKFVSRYRGNDLNDDYQDYQATGKTFAILWQHGDARFKASWGEDMIIHDDDYLCSPDRKPNGDLYRIEAKAFEETYQKIT